MKSRHNVCFFLFNLTIYYYIEFVMKTIYITETQEKKIKKAIAAQDQVGGKVNAGVMDAVTHGGGMCESIENNSLETWYRGYNSKYGSNYTHLLWLTDDIDYARVYGNRIEEITLDMSKISPISLYELDDFCDDYYNGPDEEGSEILMSEGYNCYFFYANNDGSYCMCLWDNTPIISRRELSKEEYEKIEGYPGYDIKNYDDIYEGVEDDKYELGSENGDISPYYHVNESNEEIITLYHGVNREGLEFNLEKGGFVPRVCSEGGPKAVWLSEKQYNYEFTFAFDFPKSLVEQLSNVDYIFTSKIGFNDFNCRLVKTSISSFLDNTVVETDILDNKLSKLQFRYFPDLGITLWKEFKQYPNILETYINPFIEKYQTLSESKKKVVKNDKGEVVPDTCNKCGGKVVVQIHGEPVYVCKDCGKYFGTVPFTLDESKLKEVPEKCELDESALNIEYHYTTIGNLQKMLSSEEFKLRDSQNDSFDGRKKTFFMSLTRVRSCKEGFGLYMNRTQRPLVRIELNGSALNNIRGVNIKSFDYFYHNNKVPARKYGDQRAEAEDSLTTDYEIIPNIFDLINRIDILFGPFYNYQQYKDTYQFLKWITHDNSSYMWLSKIHCYVNENSFNNKKEDEYNIKDLLRDGFFDYVIKKIGFSGMIWRLDDYYSTDNLLIFEEQNLDDVGDCGFDENLFKINLSKLNIKEKTINFSNEKRLISYLSRNGYDGYIDNRYDGYAGLTLIKNEDYFKNGIIQKFNLSNSLYENVESEIVNPEDVDLSSFSIKKNLNPKFWKNGVLDSRIRMKLLDIADDFIEFLGVDWAKPEDITMTGSLANFNWDENYSDIDLHIIMDYSDVDERTEFVSNYFYSQKKLWNEEHSDITIMGFPVEVFVQDVNERHDSSGVYSLEKNKWLIEPEREKLASSKVNKAFIKDKVSEYMNKIDKLEYLLNKSKDDEYRLRRVMEKSNKLFDKIKGERKIGFERSGGKEINNYNIVFKALKRNGYIEKLVNVKSIAYDKLNSLR